MTDYKITMDDDGKVTACPAQPTTSGIRTINDTFTDYCQRLMPDWNAMALEACDRRGCTIDDLEVAVWHGVDHGHERMTARLELCFKEGHRCMLRHEVVLS